MEYCSISVLFSSVSSVKAETKQLVEVVEVADDEFQAERMSWSVSRNREPEVAEKEAQSKDHFRDQIP